MQDFYHQQDVLCGPGLRDRGSVFTTQVVANVEDTAPETKMEPKSYNPIITLRVLYRDCFKTKVYTIGAHGPLGLMSYCR